MHAGVHARSHVCSHMAHGLGKIIEIVEARGDKNNKMRDDRDVCLPTRCVAVGVAVYVRREEMRKRMCLIYSVPLAHHLFRSPPLRYLDSRHTASRGGGGREPACPPVPWRRPRSLLACLAPSVAFITVHTMPEYERLDAEGTALPSGAIYAPRADSRGETWVSSLGTWATPPRLARVVEIERPWFYAFAAQPAHGRTLAARVGGHGSTRSSI